MRLRWFLKNEEIAQILESQGIDVMMWDVDNDGVFQGALVEGNRPECLAGRRIELTPKNCRKDG